MSSVTTLLVARACDHLQNDFPSKIARGLERLTEEQVWWRPNESSNSIGNLLLHLEGNIRQWLVSGLGGAADTRVRTTEFSQREPLPASRLLERLEETVAEAVRVLKSMDDGSLARRYEIQGFEVTGVEAVVHVVEHFSYHTGQILYIVKMLEDVDLRFYDL